MEAIHQTSVTEALAQLFRNDALLFSVGVNERSLTHKLAEYLQVQYPGWHVDCEYNRLGEHAIKRLPPPEPIESNDTKGRTIFPDIIVHKRTQRNNLLVIEVKKSGNKSNNDADKTKLAGLTTRDGDYGYRYGLHLVFAADRPVLASFTLYENGTPSQNDQELRAMFQDCGVLQ